MAFGYMILRPFPSARLLRHCNYLPDHIMLIRILSFNNQTIEPPPFQVSSIFIVKNAFQFFFENRRVDLNHLKLPIDSNDICNVGISLNSKFWVKIHQMVKLLWSKLYHQMGEPCPSMLDLGSARRITWKSALRNLSKCKAFLQKLHTPVCLKDLNGEHLFCF